MNLMKQIILKSVGNKLIYRNKILNKFITLRIKECNMICATIIHKMYFSVLFFRVMTIHRF